MRKPSVGAPKRKYHKLRHHSRLRLSFALPERVAWTENHLGQLTEIFGSLFCDENFVTLLRAESFTTVPEYLSKLFKE